MGGRLEQNFFNCYFHWLSLVLRNGSGTASFWNIRDCVNQGDPLDIVDYIIGVLPLIKRLKAVYPDFSQPW